MFVSMTGLGLIFVVCTVAAADDETATKDAKPEAAGVSSLLGMFSKSSLPSLEGLIKPDKMGVLTDNQCRVTDNEPHLLSGNKATVKLASDNQILSGITVNVHISVGANGRKSAQADKGNEKRKADKARKHKSSRKTNRR
jgi:hypothetical protein